jgi:hypothetical protein
VWALVPAAIGLGIVRRRDVVRPRRGGSCGSRTCGIAPPPWNVLVQFVPLLG